MGCVAPVATAVALLAAAAPAAHAAIVPQRSIKGVGMGMTAEQVRAALGKPDRVSYPPHEIAGSFKEYRYGLTRIMFTRGAEGAVIAVHTRSPKERTTSGVGVGSTERAVRRGVQGVRCRTEFGFRHCWVGRFEAGRVVTDFAIRRGRVVSVSLGRVID